MATGHLRPGAFMDHPVRPVDLQDPLALLNEFRITCGRMNGMTTELSQLPIGFACRWDDPPERTWSYSAWNLRAALRLATDITDIGVHIPRLSQTVLKAMHTRLLGGRLTTTWSYSRLTDAYIARALRRELSRNIAARRCQAVLTMQDLAALPVPFFLYQDISWDAWTAASCSAEVAADLLRIKPSTLARRREAQLAIYERATGIITMSRWFARTLVEQSGVPSGKVHVVHPGISAGRVLQSGDLACNPVNKQNEYKTRPKLRERIAPRRRLLFVGWGRASDFYRKGGDLVIAALALLRRDHDPQMTLTIAGPLTWPLPGSPPDGVRFLGSLPPQEVAALYDSHDLLVMPSRMEPFGIVFTEALARGLPCVARDAYAMPEIVTPGLSGALMTGDDESELADTIAATLADDALYETCYERAPELTEYFSWERAARQVAEVISHTLQSAP